MRKLLSLTLEWELRNIAKENLYFKWDFQRLTVALLEASFIPSLLDNESTLIRQLYHRVEKLARNVVVNG